MVRAESAPSKLAPQRSVTRQRLHRLYCVLGCAETRTEYPESISGQSVLRPRLFHVRTNPKPVSEHIQGNKGGGD